MKEYIIVWFWEGIGHTLQSDGKMRWCFTHRMKTYKYQKTAENIAKKMFHRFKVERIVVYKIDMNEYVSCSCFSEWDKTDKKVFEIKR